MASEFTLTVNGAKHGDPAMKAMSWYGVIGTSYNVPKER